MINDLGDNIYTVDFYNGDGPSFFHRPANNPGSTVTLLALAENNDLTLAWWGPSGVPEIKTSYTASVWFDDPVPTPIPSAGLLLLSALLPICGFKRWNRRQKNTG